MSSDRAAGDQSNSAYASRVALLVGALALVITDRVGLGVFATFSLCVLGGGQLRRWLGGDRRATVIGQLGTALVVLLVSLPAITPVPALGGGNDASWGFLAHLMLIPTVMLTVDLTTRASRAMTVFAGLVLMAAAGSMPASRGLGGPLLVFAIVAVVALSLLDVEGDRELAGLQGHRPGGVDAAAQRRSRHVALRRAGVLLLALAVIAPIAMATRPSPPSPDPTSGRSSASDTPQRYAGFSDSMDTSSRFTPSDEVVMRVVAEAPDYWRGTTFDTWDGRVWTRSDVTARRLNPSGGSVEFLDNGERAVSIDLAADGLDAVETEAFVQSFHMEVGGTDVIFGAYRMSRVTAPLSAMALFDDGTIVRRDPLGADAAYSVVSQRPIVTAALLREHDPLLEKYTTAFRERYLQLPDVPERVTALAAQLAQGKASTYDTILAMQDWLGANTSYTLDIPPLPSGADAVDQYLFVDRQGFCEQIASALTVMLRSLGVPARVATGYVAGDFDQLTGEFVVRGSDAHAWVEVYFPGVGWQGFDPTASVPLSGEFDRSFVGSLKRSIGALTWALVAVLALAALAILVLVTKAFISRRRRTPEGWATVLSRRIDAEGDRRGRPRAPTETIAAYCAALGESVLPDPRMTDVGRQLTLTLYGPVGPPTAKVHRGRLPEAETVEGAWAVHVIDEVCRTHPAPTRWNKLWAKATSQGDLVNR
ncbi:MAG: transglutaminaseTgpA domain-containing protein [Acidimicrobiia bacterium]